MTPEVARIAAALDTVPVGDYPWHDEAPHRPEYAAALYAAGLRVDLDVERLARAMRTVQPPEPDMNIVAEANGFAMDWNAWAAALAAEYARLREAPDGR